MKTTYVAMLRGINVSGRNKLAMEDLRTLVTAAGGADVRTYIQSGNAVFTSSASATRIVTDLKERLEGFLGTTVPVLVRTTAELDAAMEKNPFLRRGEDPATLHVTFMAAVPSQADVTAAQAKAVAADEFQVIGREVYLRCPDGYGTTKLTNTFFEKRFGWEATTRNWRTVTTLAAMAHG
ncbi:MAG TPA: DUF1697 domain-containing protein [Acidimicrobiales bacterium]|nr:DUF1697 domain-containing protein [Acidimicrobiales bacterium]